ncbi:uncharacterized protein CG7065-like isoform X1 [Uranotaenia lowii]|uniref:uncharacterized protein CG7065-like isoform X1 n=2 Tax=Uranotaenia lowii TaxID=190385 RepID=UPI00247A116F|nr:uncharacterized protein CG7065-like isoform X1 [Uranotaenia lowii]
MADSPVEIEDDNVIAKTKTEQDVEEHVLGSTVQLSDGTQGRVFSRSGRNKEGQIVYSCHLCGVANLPGERVLQTHIAGRKHQSRLSMPIVDAEQFRTSTAPKVVKIQMDIAPGEPVPPGMENEVKPVAQLQATIDKFKSGPMVGLEYIMELTSSCAKEPSYQCILCDKKGDPRTVMVHITSFTHRMKFLEKHYPTVINELAPFRAQRGALVKEILNRAIQTVCEAIEDHHGRLTPNVHESNDYYRNKMKYLQEVLFDKHFDERTGPKFVEVIDKKLLQEQLDASGGGGPRILEKDPSPPVVAAPQRKARSGRADRKSLDSISSIDSVQSISSGESKSKTRIVPPREGGGGGVVGFDSSIFPRRVYHPASYRDFDSRRSPDPSRRSPESRRSVDRRPGSPLRRNSSERRRSPNRRRSPLPFRRSPIERHRSRSPRRHRSPPPRRRPSPFRPSRRSPPPRRRRSRTPEKEVRSAVPTPKELAIQASAIAHERYKWEKYRCSLEIAVTLLEKTYKEHEKNPEKHPLYPEEWKKFWNRRYKELQAEKKDPSKHDFKPEWIEYWTKRMKDLHNEDIEKKKQELKKKLNLPNEEDDKLSSLKEQYILKVSQKKKSNTEPIESSEDEAMSSRPRRVSRSPISDAELDCDSRHSRKRTTSRERERERDRDRDRERHRSSSYAAQDNYDDWAKNYYGPNKKVFVRNELNVEDSTPLNFVAVCRLLTALEDHLGSLGPKVIDLLSKSLALEKVKANSADDLLLNEDNCMFLETVKEKLKGHLMADMLEKHKIVPVKKAIKNIASLLHEASKKEKMIPIVENMGEAPTLPTTESGTLDKAAIAAKLAANLVAQGKTDFTAEELEQLINVYVAMAQASKEKEKPLTTSSFLYEGGPSKRPDNKADRRDDSHSKDSSDNVESNALEGLTDSDLQTLLQNFKDLSNEEQLHLISHLKKLEKTDPLRVEKLRRYVNLDDEPSGNDPRKDYYDDLDDDQHYQNVREFDDVQPDDSDIGNPDIRNPIKSLVSGGYRSPDPYSQKKLLDSEDEDDYSYDDVVRAASKNLPPSSNKPSTSSATPRNDFMSDNYDASSNFSRTSNDYNSQKEMQNTISNMMSSLPKSNFGQAQNYNNPINTIGQMPGEPRKQSSIYDNHPNPVYGNQIPVAVRPPTAPTEPFMNQNRPQFAPIQTANTSMNSMPYYYQQQMRAQQQNAQPTQQQQQQQMRMGYPGVPGGGQFGGQAGMPPGPNGQNPYMWQQQQQQQQQAPPQGGAPQYPYGNNFY